MPPVQYHYGQFPPQNIDWARLVPLIGPASRALGDFNGLLAAMPNADILLSPLATQEAVLSSRIEGTQATLIEVLEYEAGARRNHSPDRINDIKEIQNYRQAIQHASKCLDNLPISGRLIKETHAILMQGVRGKDKNAGQYKSLPNAIEPYGCTAETAKFLPITPNKLADGMANWEKFIHSKQSDILVQLAIMHAELESLHPFADGNGRIGRMLLPLFLYERNILSRPAFYLSEYLEAHREEYYERLLAVSRDLDWTRWCQFFLQGVKAQAETNIQKAKTILDLYAARKEWMLQKTHSRYAVPALDFMFRQPIFRGAQFGRPDKIPQYTARHILKKIRNDLLLEILPASGRQSAIFVYRELINIAEGRKIF